MNHEEILRRLTALDFVAVDLALFLDTHPDDREALDTYNDILTQADALRKQYEQLCGPLCSYRSMSAYPWQWIDDPWPWQYTFNFNLPREEC